MIGGLSWLRWNHVVGTVLADKDEDWQPLSIKGFSRGPELDRDNFLVGGAWLREPADMFVTVMDPPYIKLKCDIIKHRVKLPYQTKAVQ